MTVRLTRRSAAAAVVALVLGACSSDDGGDNANGAATTGTEVIDAGSATSPVPVATATPPTTATTATTGIGSDTTVAASTTAIGTTTTAPLPPLTDVTVALTSVTDLDGPIVLVPRSGDDAFYIGERRGVVYAVSDERGDVVLDISDRTTTDSERGLLGLAFSPDGTRLYVSSTDNNGDSVIEEYLVDSDGVADIETRRLVIEMSLVSRPCLQRYADHGFKEFAERRR